MEPLEIVFNSADTGYGGEAHTLIPSEDIVKIQVDNLPTANELQRQIAAVVVHSIRQILNGKLKFRSAGEAAKVARDFVGIAKDLQWAEEADTIANARTQEERLEAFRMLKEKAGGQVLALTPERKPDVGS
jgi:hypothetical protein